MVFKKNISTYVCHLQVVYNVIRSSFVYSNYGAAVTRVWVWCVCVCVCIVNNVFRPIRVAIARATFCLWKASQIHHTYVCV
jgi:hypothetical protein